MMPNMTEAEEQAKKECSSFVNCAWDEFNRILVFWFKNPLDAENFRVQRDIRDKSIRREAKAGENGSYSVMREFYQ